MTSRSSAFSAVTRLAATLAIVLSSGGVLANELDPDKELHPEDEKEFRREGFAIGVGLGPSLSLGSGNQNDARGGGGGFALRVGTSAGDKLLWFAQLDAIAHSETSGNSVLSVGAHYYLREALWVRGGLGLASFYRRAEDPNSGGESQTEGGTALTGGAGVDIYRRGIFALDLELSITRSGFSDGKITVGALELVANWY